MLAFDAAVNIGVVGTGGLTVSSAGNRLLVAYVTQFGNVTQPSVSYQGNSMTYAGSSGQTNNLCVFGFYLIAPPTGAGTFACTFGGGANSICLASYTDALQSGQPDATKATTVASNQNPAGTINNANNGNWDTIGWYTDNTVSSFTNATGRGAGTNGAGVADSNTGVGAGNYIQTINLAGAGNTAIFQMAVAGVPTSSGLMTRYW